MYNNIESWCSMGKIKDNIAVNLVFFLKERNMTQKELAEKLDVARSSVTNWIKNNNLPDIDVLQQICEILNITLADLLGIDLNDSYTEIEKKIIMQYRNKPELQEAVRVLLDIKNK